MKKLIIILGVVGASLSAILVRFSDAPSMVLVFYRVLFGSLFTGDYVVPVSAKNVLIGLGLTVFCTLLGHSIFSWGLKYEKAAFVSTAKLLEPIFASIFGLILFSEIPPKTSILGGIMIIIGIVVMCREEAKQD